MKEVTFQILTTSGNVYRWTFTECETDPNDYGNKHYIAYKMPSGDSALIDCRYMGAYNFTKICVEFLINYYGDNLDELSEADEEEPEPVDDYYFSDGMHW